MSQPEKLPWLSFDNPFALSTLIRRGLTVVEPVVLPPGGIKLARLPLSSPRFPALGGVAAGMLVLPHQYLVRRKACLWGGLMLGHVPENDRRDLKALKKPTDQPSSSKNVRSHSTVEFTLTPQGIRLVVSLVCQKGSYSRTCFSNYLPNQRRQANVPLTVLPI